MPLNTVLNPSEREEIRGKIIPGREKGNEEGAAARDSFLVNN